MVILGERDKLQDMIEIMQRQEIPFLCDCRTDA